MKQETAAAAAARKSVSTHSPICLGRSRSRLPTPTKGLPSWRTSPDSSTLLRSRHEEVPPDDRYDAPNER